MLEAIRPSPVPWAPRLGSCSWEGGQLCLRVRVLGLPLLNAGQWVGWVSGSSGNWGLAGPSWGVGS